MGGVIDDRSVDFVVTLRSGRDSIERESERVGPGIGGESGGKSGRKGGGEEGKKRRNRSKGGGRGRRWREKTAESGSWPGGGRHG